MDLAHGFTMDVTTKQSRRISFGIEQYTSIAASADGQRLVATVEHSHASLWRVPISDRIAQEADAARLHAPTVGASSPRLGSGYTVYVAPKNNGHALWLLQGTRAQELWSAAQARIIGGPAISPSEGLIAFTAEGRAGTQLYVTDVRSKHTRQLGSGLNIRGTPAWSHDGQSVIVAAEDGGEPKLFNVPLDSGSPRRLLTSYSINPIALPQDRIFIYADADTGPDFILKAVDINGRAQSMPEIRLPRGVRRVAVVPGRRALIVLKGEMRHTNFWYIDLDSGLERQLSDFGREYTVREFDVSADGREIVFDRRRENSDIALIELRNAN